MIHKRQLILAVLSMMFAADIHAEFGLTAARENFRWREFDTGGSRLLEETGPRYHFGADWRQSLGSDTALLLHVRGSLYFGDIDYDGQACTISSGLCSPFQSDADYNGAAGEVTLVRQIGGAGGEIFAGGGIDTWQRDIRGQGSVSGAIENWTVFYLTAGGGAFWNRSSNRFGAHAGLKYPFYTGEETDFGVSLNPKGKLSLSVRASMDVLDGSRPVWGVQLYYDSYRFDESNRERVGAVVVWQPESHQDVFGIRAVIYLR